MRSRYKESDVGIIPEDWEVYVISDVCKLINGRGFKPHEWNSVGLPIIRIQNINGSEEFNYYQGNYDKKIEIEKGQLLFAWSGSRGTSFGPNFWHGNKGLLNYHTWKVLVNKDSIEEGFFYYALKQLTKYIEDNAHGASALVHTQKWEMETFKFPSPVEKNEQKAIAEVLSDTDKLIQSLEKQIAKKRLIKQGAMQNLLSLKEGWEESLIGDFGKTYGGLSGKSKSDFQDGNYPYIPFMNIMTNPKIDIGYMDYVKIKPHESQNKALKDDLFFNGSSETPEEVGMCSVLTVDLPNLYLNSFCFGFRLNEECKHDGLFLSYYFRSDYGRKMFYSLAQGATRYNLSKSNFLKMKLFLPPPEDQSYIATILSDIDAEIELLKNKVNKYKTLKKGLMQNLLTGKIRLKTD